MSAPSSAKEVEEFLAGLPRQHRQIARALRRLVRHAVPEAAESILWGSLSYHRAHFGGRIKGAVCLITPQPNGVHLGFIHGSAIADPLHLLRSSGEHKRYVPIQSIQEINPQALSRLVRAAAEYDPRAAS